jgi:hypothetical protein
MMKILVTLQTTEGTKPEDLRTYLVEENKAVWELYKTDVIREMYFRGDGQGAIFVVESANEDVTKEIFLQLPMVRDGLLKAEFILLKPFTQIEFAFAK